MTARRPGVPPRPWRGGLQAAAVAWGGIVTLTCVVALVAPRLSPLPLLWQATAASRGVAAVLLPFALVVALHPWLSPRWRGHRWLCAAAAPGAAACLVDAVVVVASGAWNAGGAPYRANWQALLPLTVPVTLVLGGWGGALLWRCWRGPRARRSTAAAEPPPRGARRWAGAAGRLGLAGLVLSLLGVDVVLYHASLRAPATRAPLLVVMGAGANRDGTPSDALRDRVRTAAALARRDGGARVLMTGGVSGGVSEPRVMRRVAEAAGIAAARITLDEAGANTAASIAGLARRVRAAGPGGAPVTIVSHGHHLARIRLLCRRAGLRCQLVAARQPHGLRGELYFVLREVAALVYCGATGR